jgi:hypothetical protein
VTLRARRGVGPQLDDCATISIACQRRALLEDMRPTRARSGGAPTLKRSEIEVWLEHFLRNGGEERLNSLRDQIKALAPSLKMEQAAGELDAMVALCLAGETRNYRRQ